MGDTNSPTDADSRTDTILKRLGDFLCPERLGDFLSQEVGFFFVLRGWVIFLSLEVR